MTISIPSLNSRAASLGYSETGVFIRSIRRAISISKRSGMDKREKYISIVAQLDQAARRIEMSAAYKAGKKGETHARIATAMSLHQDVQNCLNEALEEYDNA